MKIKPQCSIVAAAALLAAASIERSILSFALALPSIKNHQSETRRRTANAAIVHPEVEQASLKQKPATLEVPRLEVVKPELESHDDSRRQEGESSSGLTDKQLTGQNVGGANVIAQDHPSATDKEILLRKKELLVSILGSASGVANAIYFRQFECTPTMMTGNTIRFATSLADWTSEGKGLSKVLFNGCTVAGYLVGVSIFRALDLMTKEYKIAGAWLRRRRIRKQQQLLHSGVSAAAGQPTSKHDSLSLVVPAALLLFAIPDLAGFLLPHKWTMPLLAIAFGMVNGAAQSVSGNVINAATGHITRLGLGLTDSMLLGGGTATTKPTSGLQTSGKFLSSFILSIVVASLAYPWLARLPVERFPLGTAFGILYAVLFGWYAS